MQTKKPLFIITLFLCLFFELKGQITFERQYTMFSEAISVIQTSDSSYIMACHTNTGLPNIAWCKINNMGVLLWIKYFIQPYYCYCEEMISTSDGGYVIVGTTKLNYSALSKIIIIKLDSNADIIWSRTLEGTLDKFAFSVTEASAGRYVIAGNHGINPYIAQLNNDGIVEWENTYSWQGTLFSIKNTFNSGLVSVGKKKENYSNYFFIAQFDSIGDTLWTQKFGYRSRNYDITDFCIIQSFDSNFVAVGSAYDYNTSNLLVIKVDTTGSVIWEKVYNGDYSGHYIQQDPDSNYIITGSIDYISEINTGDIFLFKINPLGDSLWTRYYDGIGTSETSECVINTNDGGYAICGKQEYFLIHPEFWNWKYAYLIKTNEDGTLLGISEHESFTNKTDCQVYPNPAENKITVESESIYDIDLISLNGQTLNRYVVEKNWIIIDMSEYENGMYFLKVTSESGVYMKKVIVNR